MDTFPRYWPFVRGIHRSPVNSAHKGQRRRALMFSLIYAWTNGWVNNRETGDLKRHRAHYDVIVIFAGNSSVTGEFPAQRSVTWSFDVFFDLRLNKPLCKQSWGWWFETPSCSLWRHCNVMPIMTILTAFVEHILFFSKCIWKLHLSKVNHFGASPNALKAFRVP